MRLARRIFVTVPLGTATVTRTSVPSAPLPAATIALIPAAAAAVAAAAAASAAALPPPMICGSVAMATRPPGRERSTACPAPEAAGTVELLSLRAVPTSPPLAPPAPELPAGALGAAAKAGQTRATALNLMERIILETASTRRPAASHGDREEVQLIQRDSQALRLAEETNETV